MRLRYSMGFLMLACMSLFAQTPTHYHHPQDSTAKIRELPPPPLMQGIGDAYLKITTNSDQAQAYFNQGLRLLHCFWEFEAYRAFKEAARLDPAAAMAYWGQFEALRMFLRHGSARKEKAAALEKAKSLAVHASEHEQLYIRAAEHQQKDDDSSESAAYRSAMENLIDRYSDDPDARAFLALEEMGGYQTNGHPRGGEIYSQSILRNLLAEHPDNAAANHYWIHAMEGSSRPEGALRSADALARLAPNSGHMVHMPGHIYWRIGDYARARQSFIAALRVDEAYLAAQGIHPEEDWNYAHNLAYLIAACAEAGRYHEGLEWAAKLRGMPSPEGMTSSRFAIWAGASVARLRIRFGDWAAVQSEAIELGTSAEAASPAAKVFARGLSVYAKGMAGVERGDAKQAEQESETLDVMLWRLEASKPEKNEDDQPDDKDKSEASDEDDPTQVLNLLGALSLDLRANVRGVQIGREGEDLFQKAVEKENDLGYSEPPELYRPEKESLGYAYLRARQWDKARKAFEEALKQRLKSGHALYGIAQSYALAGDSPKGVQAYREFLTSWGNADPDLPQIRQAKNWLGSHTR